MSHDTVTSNFYSCMVSTWRVNNSTWRASNVALNFWEPQLRFVGVGNCSPSVNCLLSCTTCTTVARLSPGNCPYHTTYRTNGNATLSKHFVEVVVDATHYCFSFAAKTFTSPKRLPGLYSNVRLVPALTFKLVCT